MRNISYKAVTYYLKAKKIQQEVNFINVRVLYVCESTISSVLSEIRAMSTGKLTCHQSRTQRQIISIYRMWRISYTVYGRLVKICKKCIS